MWTIGRIWRRLTAVARGRKLDAEMHEEMQFHLEQEAGALEADGMPAAEARRQAALRFGGLPRHEEAGRDARGITWFRDFSADLRYGVRSLRRTPVFAVTAVLTLGFGIAACATIFSLADVYLFRPLPFPHGDRLLMLYDEQHPGDYEPASLPEFQDWRTGLHTVDVIVAGSTGNVTWVGTESAERVRLGRVTEGYFDLLGVPAIAGRVLRPADHQPGADPVVIVSRRFWHDRLGGAPEAIGRPISLEGKSYTVIGVVERGLAISAAVTEAWVPLEPAPPWTERGTHYLTMFGRLKDGTTLAAARAEMATLGTQLREANGTTHGLAAVPLRDSMVGNGRVPLLVLFAAVACLLLISLANLAGLLQARASARGREFALRAALGAGRGRLLRQTAAEVLLLALLGGAVGIAGAWGGVRLLLGLWPATLPLPLTVRVDQRVILFALGAALVCGFLAALSPEMLRLHGEAFRVRGATHNRRFRRLLVAGEVALTVVLLVGAGLTLRSLDRLLRVDPGFQPEGLLTFRVNLPANRYDQPERQRAFFDDLLGRLRQDHRVKAADLVLNLPLSGGGMNGDLAIDGREFPEGEVPNAEKHIVTDSYFTTMGIRLVRGRLFSSGDRAGTPEVAIVNRTMAAALWPDRDPLGARIHVLGKQGEWQEVVGVVEDVRLDGLDAQPRNEAYIVFDQHPAGGMFPVVRHTGEPGPVVLAARAAVRELDPALPVYAFLPMPEVVARSVAIRRLPAVLLAGFGATALLLAAVGLYGLLAYSVTQRTREIGVRMALGAERGRVVREVLGDGIRLVLAGAAVGLVLAGVLSRTVTRLLYDTTPLDLPTYFSATGTLLLVAFAACAIPALRAARVQPVMALGAE